MKKIILIILIIIILATTGGVIIYAKDSPVFDIFFSEKEKEERDFKRLEKLYPQKIGNYTLFKEGPQKVTKRFECNKVDENDEFCSRFTIGQYRMAGSNKVLFVYLHKITKGKDLLKTFLTKYTLDKLNDYDIIRIDKSEISWLPTKGCDFILTQESAVEPLPDGGESFIYKNKATGDNLVTQYFISKYPPVPAGD